MDEPTRRFIHELATKRQWSFVNEIIYRSLPATGRTVSIECIALNPLNFEAREYLTSDDLGESMYSHYSRLEYILQNPPYSEEEIRGYEARHSITLPELARTFLTRVSKSLLNIDKIYDAWFPEGRDNFEYSVFDFDDIIIAYGQDDYWDDKKEKYTSRVVDIFTGRKESLKMVIDGPHRGRIFDFHSSSGIGATQDQVDFFLNGMTPRVENREYDSIMYRVFPGLRKSRPSEVPACIAN